MQNDEIKHRNFSFPVFRSFYVDYLQDTPADLKATREPDLDV